jgi:hypothetical protein
MILRLNAGWSGRAKGASLPLHPDMWYDGISDTQSSHPGKTLTT